MKGTWVYDALGQIADHHLDEALADQPRGRTAIISSRRMSFRVAAAAVLIFLVWTGILNVFPTAAYALSRAPFLSRVVAAFSFDPSLRACLTNNFAQYVGESQTVAGYRSRVCFMVVDAAHFSVFFNIAMPGREMPDELQDFSVEMTDEAGNQLPYSGAYTSPTPVASLFEYRMDRADTEADIPDRFVFRIRFWVKSAAGTDAQEIGQSTYILAPDLSDATRIKSYAIDQPVNIAGQVINFERLDVYPTQSRLLIRAAKTNTLRLDYVSVDLKDETGRVYPSLNDLAGTSNEDGIDSVWFASAFFSHVKTLTVTLSDAQFTAKVSMLGSLHLASQSIDGLPADVTITSMALAPDRSLELVLQVAKKSQTAEFAWRPFTQVFWTDRSNPLQPTEMLGGTSTTGGYWSVIQAQWIEGDPTSEYHAFVIPEYANGICQIEWREQLWQDLTPPWSVEIDLSQPAD